MINSIFKLWVGVSPGQVSLNEPSDLYCIENEWNPASNLVAKALVNERDVTSPYLSLVSNYSTSSANILAENTGAASPSKYSPVKV